MSKKEKLSRDAETVGYTFTQATVEIFLNFLETQEILGDYCNNIVDPEQKSRLAPFFGQEGSLDEIMASIFKETGIESIIDTSFTWARCKYPDHIAQGGRSMQSFWQNIDRSWKTIWREWYKVLKKEIY